MCRARVRVAQNLRAHWSRRHAVRSGARAGQTLRELQREQTIRELRMVIAASVPSLAGEIVELNSTCRWIAMIPATQRHDAPLRCRRDKIQQSIREEKVPEM